MLYEFLTEHKGEILQLCKNKVIAAGEAKPTSPLLDQGLPHYYDQLIRELQRATTGTDSKTTPAKSEPSSGEAAAHGKESLRLGYTISQVVHTSGAVCQTITEFVQTKSYDITSREFQCLNLSLDSAIAESVTEFEQVQRQNISSSENERLGFLIHELGGSLAAAALALHAIQSGQVGMSGATSQLLGQAHERMRHLISSSLAEVRMRGKAPLELSQICLMDIVSEVEATATLMGKSKEIHFLIDVDPTIRLLADRHLFFSALSNLVSNAMKFTKKKGRVLIQGKESEGRILIEVEDECGGLPEGKTEELFKPFVKKGTDKSGMGLGLSISRRAIELNKGTLTVRDIPGKGCVFTIDLPNGE